MTDHDWQILLLPASQGGFLGLPFKWGARGPEAYDCWGLVATLRARMGQPVPDDWGVPKCDVGAALAVFARESESQDWQSVPLGQHQPGDIIALSTHRRIHHVGLATPWGVIHAARGCGSVHQDLAGLRRAGYQLIQPYQYHGVIHG